jgi:hypothetical protein
MIKLTYYQKEKRLHHLYEIGDRIYGINHFDIDMISTLSPSSKIAYTFTKPGLTLKFPTHLTIIEILD